RGGHRQGALYGRDVLGRRPGDDAARALRVRSRGVVQSGQGLSFAPALRRQAGAVPAASNRAVGGSVARVTAGSIGEVQALLALDPPHPVEATLGGIVAANSFGPLRTRYGSVRDLIIGVSILRADGTRAKGGGKVVKTVAGFDLPKLMCGSFGTLAFIATATFRVHPLPEKTVTLRARGSDPLELVRRVRALQLEPAAMIALGEGAGWDVYLRFEGFRSGVRAQREKLRELEEAEWPGHAEGAVRLRFGGLPTHAGQVATALAPLR